MKIEKQRGDIRCALEYLIQQLVLEKRYDLLEKWDSMRGNDWIIKTEKDYRKNTND